MLSGTEESAQEFYTRGKEFLDQGYYEQAITEFDKGHTIMPNLIIFASLKAIALAQLGRHLEAVTIYDQLLLTNPNMSELLAPKGASLGELERNEEALACLDMAIHVDPECGIAFHEKADILCKLGRFEESLPLYDKAIEINEADDQEDLGALWISKGIAMTQLGKLQEALVCFDRASDFSGDESLDAIIKEKRTALIEKIKSLVRLKQESREYITPDLKEQSNSLLREVGESYSKMLAGAKFDQAAFDSLVARIEALERNIVRRNEVSHAIKANPALEAADAERERIRANPKLHAYYRSFNSAFNQSFVASMTQASGKVALTPKVISIPVDDLGKLIPIPFVSDVAQAICTVTNMALKIVEANNVRRLASLAISVTDMEAKIEEVARKLALQKEAEIIAVTDKSHWVVTIFADLKDKVYFNAYDTPEKKLGLTDATRLLISCMAGKVDTDRDLIQQFLLMLQEDAGISLTPNPLVAKSAKTEAAASSVPFATVSTTANTPRESTNKCCSIM